MIRKTTPDGINREAISLYPTQVRPRPKPLVLGPLDRESLQKSGRDNLVLRQIDRADSPNVPKALIWYLFVIVAAGFAGAGAAFVSFLVGIL